VSKINSAVSVMQAPFGASRHRQLIKALFPALRRHLGETGLKHDLPAITLRSHLGELVLKHHQHLFGDVGPHLARTRASDRLTGQCVCHGSAAQVHRWLREKPVSGPVRRAE
jgi:hypothetical protein